MYFFFLVLHFMHNCSHFTGRIHIHSGPRCNQFKHWNCLDYVSNGISELIEWQPYHPSFSRNNWKWRYKTINQSFLTFSWSQITTITSCANTRNRIIETFFFKKKHYWNMDITKVISFCINNIYIYIRILYITWENKLFNYYYQLTLYRSVIDLDLEDKLFLWNTFMWVTFVLI